MPFLYASFTPNLTDRSACASFVETELEKFGIELPEDADLALELSAGTDADGITVYRPKAYTADVLDRSDPTNYLNDARGITFRDVDKAIKAWRAEQAQQDASFGLKLPAGVSATLQDGPYSGPVRAVFRL